MEDFSDLLNQQILCLPNKCMYKLYIYCTKRAHPGGRAVKGAGLRPFA
jgi:hypothetical protein